MLHSSFYFIGGLYTSMHLYDKNGYVDIPEILKHEAIFIFIYGGRGTGKTYGTLKSMVTDKHKFIYMRRLQAQADS